VDHAAGLVEDGGEVVGGRGGRRDRVHAAHLEAGGHRSHRDRGVAAHHHHRRGLFLAGDGEALVEMLDRPGVAGIEQPVVHVDHVPALAPALEDLLDLLLGDLQVPAVEGAEQPHHPHVLAALRVVGDLAGLAVEGDLPHLVAARAEVVQRLLVRLLDLGVRVARPAVVDQQHGAAAQRVLVDAAVEHLLVEGDHQVGLVMLVTGWVAKRMRIPLAPACERAGGSISPE
jgi:hypothetical protein